MADGFYLEEVYGELFEFVNFGASIDGIQLHPVHAELIDELDDEFVNGSYKGFVIEFGELANLAYGQEMVITYSIICGEETSYDLIGEAIDNNVTISSSSAPNVTDQESVTLTGYVPADDPNPVEKDKEAASNKEVAPVAAVLAKMGDSFKWGIGLIAVGALIALGVARKRKKTRA